LYRDNLPYDQYVNWSRHWIKSAYRILKPTGSLYVAIGDEYAAEVKVLLREAGFKFRNWIIWHYTFGQNTKKKFGRCHTHILYFVKDLENFIWNPSEIFIPSARQLKYNDRRANSTGKIPDDVWEVYARDVECRAHELRLYPEDTLLWNDSRLCGTFHERLVKEDGSAHPCQMPLSVLDRIIRVSSNPGSLVVDPFSGTATTACSAKSLGRNYITMDIDPEYVDVSKKRLDSVVFGGGLSGKEEKTS
jgi:site-specific DNA-methyltransferase (adenine-specific)